MSTRWTLAAAVALVAWTAEPCRAQESRQALLEAERAERATQVAPYEPGRLEGALLWIERSRLGERLFGGGDGLYPLFGSVTRGAGPAFGVGWRRHFAADRFFLNVAGTMSTRGYRTGRVEVRLPALARRRLEVGARARHRYFPQEDYFGLGSGSSRQDRTNYLLSETEFSGFGIYRPTRWLIAGGQVAHLSPSVREGTDSRYPSIETLFNEQTAPGLTRQPNFVETGGLVEADFRDQPGNPRSGGRLSLLIARYDDRPHAGFDFTRLAFVAEQHVPIFDKKRVFSARLVTNRLGADGEVPFYYMTALGGKDTIRGLLDYRLRDRAWMVLNTEYRWEAVTGLEMALFHDIGAVSPRWRSLSLGDAKRSYGLALRVGTAKSIVVRTEVAFGSGEGTRAFVAFGPPLRIERYLR